MDHALKTRQSSLMKLPFTLINTGLCQASKSKIYLDSVVLPTQINPLADNKLFYQRDKYLSLGEGAQFSSQTIWIKFLNVGKNPEQSTANIESFSGGHVLNTWVRVTHCEITDGGQSIVLVNPNTGSHAWFSTGNANNVEAQIVVATEFDTDEFDAMPYIDIIGDIHDVVRVFPKGVMGQWNPYYVPKSVPMRFKLNQQAGEGGPNFCAYLANDEWQTVTGAMNLAVSTSTISNESTLVPLSSGSIALYFYDALSQ
ncbi:hypothetical protein [Pseudoalteromonas sp. MMG005]|uniref:hypothetical protein n=1 Tax=Pseudoalteromonas sp. MMG005 TaxID=2822682 RepID=UPI001B39E779|nr:hypothetical protein [Pseudoalteromonas sp. MMG005]MBQ4844934.1 hypothetical protein [Pseudoalteromonas sp. MMG005]